VALLMLGGIAVGPSGLGWLQPNPAIDLFEKIGLGLIFALIGLTIDQKTLGDTAGRLGFLGWLATLAIGTLLATLLPLGDGLRPLALVVALSSTAFSTLFVILKDSGEWEAPLGRLLRSAGTWGQLGPVLAVALLSLSLIPKPAKSLNLSSLSIQPSPVVLMLRFTMSTTMESWISSQQQAPVAGQQLLSLIPKPAKYFNHSSLSIKPLPVAYLSQYKIQTGMEF
jgi:Kef-type K+ transport system membrane component KefB